MHASYIRVERLFSLNEGTAWIYRNEGARSRRRPLRRMRWPPPVALPPFDNKSMLRHLRAVSTARVSFLAWPSTIMIVIRRRWRCGLHDVRRCRTHGKHERSDV